MIDSKKKIELAEVIFFIDATIRIKVQIFKFTKWEGHDFFFLDWYMYVFFFTFYNVSDCRDEFNDLLHDKV